MSGTFGKLWAILAGADDENDGMIALLPRAAEAQAFVVPGGDPLDALHVTIQYLSEDLLPSLDPTMLKGLCDQVSGQFGPIEARVMGHATFNPDHGPNGDMDPCAVYLVSDSPELAALARTIQDAVPDPAAHAPFLCHMTAGYGLTAAQLRMVGPIVFDRLRLAVGTDVQDFPL